MKFVVILILVVFLSTLFGNIGGFFTAFLNGGQILFNSLSIFITFFGRAIEPIITKPYLSMIIYIFLFANVFIFIIQVIVSNLNTTYFEDDQDDEIDENILVSDGNGNVYEQTNTYKRTKKFSFKKGKYYKTDYKPTMRTRHYISRAPKKQSSKNQSYKNKSYKR